eukprot:gene8495-biopygen21158
MVRKKTCQLPTCNPDVCFFGQGRGFQRANGGTTPHSDAAACGTVQCHNADAELESQGRAGLPVQTGELRGWWHAAPMPGMIPMVTGVARATNLSCLGFLLARGGACDPTAGGPACCVRTNACAARARRGAVEAKVPLAKQAGELTRREQRRRGAEHVVDFAVLVAVPPPTGGEFCAGEKRKRARTGRGPHDGMTRAASFLPGGGYRPLPAPRALR